MTSTSTPHPVAPIDVAALRAAEWPWMLTGETTYLNNASLGPLPLRAVRAIDAFTRLRHEPQRITVPYQFGVLTRARELAAQLVNGSPDEIALMVNTTYGINVAARCLPLAAGDVVLTVDREFPANVYPWMALGVNGVVYHRVPCVDDVPDEDALLAAIADTPRLRVVTVSWASFSSGAVIDLTRIGAACRARGGVTFVVDAIQALGAMPIDVRACGVDILASGGQKWLLSPWGTGFVWMRRELVQSLAPNPVGWMAPSGTDDFSTMLDYRLAWRDNARRFEVISLPFQDFAGFNEGVGLLLELGIGVVHAHVEQILDAAIEVARARGLRIVTPVAPGRRAGILAIVPAGDVRRASRRLLDAGFTHAVREGAVRLSPHCFSAADEVCRAVEMLAAPSS